MPTEAPLVTPPAPAMETMPAKQEEPSWLSTVENIADTAKWPLAGVAGVLLILLLIGAVRRGKRKSQSNRAMDHLEGAVYRDYSAAPRGGKRSVITDSTDVEKDESLAPPLNMKENEGTAQNSELMAETLKRLYTEEKPAEAAETPETVEEIAAKAETGAGANGADGAGADVTDQETKRIPVISEESAGSEAAPRRRSRRE